MTNEVDDIREIIHVGDLFGLIRNIRMKDGTIANKCFQVFGLTKKSVKLMHVDVPDNYDFSKKELLEPILESDSRFYKPFITKKVHIEKDGTPSVHMNVLHHGNRAFRLNTFGDKILG